MELVSFLYEGFHQQFREPSALQGSAHSPPRIWAQICFPQKRPGAWCMLVLCVCLSVCIYLPCFNACDNFLLHLKRNDVLLDYRKIVQFQRIPFT